jgi:crotonobetainyl-CoA:carnitine CoA-transferase CaiB-like acyl-CoA transferase
VTPPEATNGGLGTASGLEDVRVIDFGHHIAGPLAALLLADAGADVVHVDRPGGAGSLGLVDAFLQRNKRRITLDLKDAADADVARTLVRDADVIVENFRPGTMSRLGLGPDELLGADPRLVYCSLPGFGSTDRHADVAGWEGILHAATAGYRPLNEHWDPSGRPRAQVSDRTAPLFTPITTASNFGGMLGAFSIVAALIAREATGRGQHVEVPLVEAMAEAYSTMLGHHVYADTSPADNQMLRDLTHVCQDGALIDCSPWPKFVIGLLRGAGVADEWEALGLIDVERNTFALDRRDEIEDMFAALVGSRPAKQWEDIAIEQRLPLAMVRTRSQWLVTTAAREAGVVACVDDPIAGPTVTPGGGFDLSARPTPMGPRRAPDPDRDDVLAELRAPRGGTPPGLRGGVELERPLDGFRVIDMTQAVAGPTAARLLADFGADVVKVGNPVPGVTDGIIGHLHRGKRTMLLDTTVPEGREVLARLVEHADALVTNFTATSAAKYHLDADHLRAANPDLVYCSITAYGGNGPWSERRAYENQANAATGMSSSYGSSFGWTLYQPTPINDAATGILGALGVVIALYARLRGAPGQRVGTSLAQASTWHQAVGLVVEVDAIADVDVTRSERGTSATSRLYRAEDRWLWLECPVDDLAWVLHAMGVDADDDVWSTAADPDGALALLMADRFLGAPAHHWERALTVGRVAALTVWDIDEAAAYLADRGVVYHEPGVEGDFVPRPGIGSWLSETPPRVGPNPGAVGSQVIEILAELGLDDDEIAGLGARGVVRLPDALPHVNLWT